MAWLLPEYWPEFGLSQASMSAESAGLFLPECGEGNKVLKVLSGSPFGHMFGCFAAFALSTSRVWRSRVSLFSHQYDPLLDRRDETR
jgi:hypothetical protein